jgi:signal transduction histidine kinase
LIACLTVVPIGTLLWQASRLLHQDRQAEREQIQQRVDRSADLLMSVIERAIAASSDQLATGNEDWPAGAVAVTLQDGRVTVAPAGRAAYLPVVAPQREPSPALFARGDDLELRQHDVPGALAVFRELERSADPATRAGALLRLGHLHQKTGQVGQASATYRELSEIEDVSIDGQPAALIAAYAQAKLLQSQQRETELRALGVQLLRDLRSGKWPLTWAVYQTYASDAAVWSGLDSQQPPGSIQSEVFADAIQLLWQRQSGRGLAPHGASAIESLDVHGHPLIVLTRPTEDSVRALLAVPQFVGSEWLAAAVAIAQEQSVALNLLDARGALVFGQPAPATGYIKTKPAAESGLPWTISVTSVVPEPETSAFARRRQLLAAGLALLVTLALAASYFIVRAISRELAVARLQTEFVAAVSHEFRTPLTSLRQFTDILREQPGLAEEQRRLAYEAQSRATDRLTHLVESLLDFGRMEAGARRYKLERHDSATAVRRFVEDFRPEATASGHEIEFRGTDSGEIEVDADALGLAVRNLLDNAVKYSPGSSSIEVGLARHNGHVHISVRDRGLGIPVEERSRLFAKFHRGAEAQSRGIRGTGIGLTMAHEIVRAHRGQIEVESTPGKGSTFTIVLPVAEGKQSLQRPGLQAG